MKTLKSIGGVLKILGKSCSKCLEEGKDGIYYTVDKYHNEYTGRDFALFYCDRFVLPNMSENNPPHKKSIPIRFETSLGDTERLILNIQRFTKNNLNKDMPDSERKAFLKKADSLTQKLRCYALFAAEDLKLEFNGYCPLCFREIPIIIEKRKIDYPCSECIPKLSLV